MAKDENPWCYIGRRKSCNCVVAAAVEQPGDEKEMAKWVAERIREGLVLDRMRVVEVRKQFGCEHTKKPKQESLPMGV